MNFPIFVIICECLWQQLSKLRYAILEIEMSLFCVHNFNHFPHTGKETFYAKRRKKLMNFTNREH